MSNNLLRKLLRATSDYDDAVQPITDVNKKRKRKEPEESKIASEQDVVDWRVANMLALDRSLAAKDVPKSQQLKESKRSKATTILLNRTSAVQANIVHEPTFDRKKYKREKKQASIKKIAKLLQKRTSKKL